MFLFEGECYGHLVLAHNCKSVGHDRLWPDPISPSQKEIFKKNDRKSSSLSEKPEWRSSDGLTRPLCMDSRKIQVALRVATCWFILELQSILHCISSFYVNESIVNSSFRNLMPRVLFELNKTIFFAFAAKHLVVKYAFWYRVPNTMLILLKLLWI